MSSCEMKNSPSPEAETGKKNKVSKSGKQEQEKCPGFENEKQKRKRFNACEENAGHIQ